MLGGGGGDGGFGPAGGGGPPGLRDGPYDGPPASGAPNPLTGPPAPLNEDGLPVRPDKESCLYYLNTGTCRSGLQCIFNHPPKNAREDELKKSLSKAGMPDTPGGMLLPSTDSPANMGPPGAQLGGLSAGMQGMLEKLEALQSGGKDDSSGTAPASAPGVAPGLAPPDLAPGLDAEKNGDGSATQPAAAPGTAPMLWTPPEPPKEVEYNEEGLPIRPGMQKCGYFLKSGKCTYGPTCRFDHPAGLGGLMAGGGGIGFGNFPGMVGGPMTEGAMAMRPGKDQCPFLARTGTCPFGPECRFDHSGGTPTPGAASPEGGSPGGPVSTPPSEPLSKKKMKGLGGTRGRRPPPAGSQGRQMR